jgi:hypothetical protein
MLMGTLNALAKRFRHVRKDGRDGAPIFNRFSADFGRAGLGLGVDGLSRLQIGTPPRLIAKSQSRPVAKSQSRSLASSRHDGDCQGLRSRGVDAAVEHPAAGRLKCPAVGLDSRRAAVLRYRPEILLQWQ